MCSFECYVLKINRKTEIKNIFKRMNEKLRKQKSIVDVCFQFVTFELMRDDGCLFLCCCCCRRRRE